MRATTCLTVVLLSFTGMLRADEKGPKSEPAKAADNPFKTAKVGDYTVYKITVKGQPTTSTSRQTVVEVSAQEVVVELKTSVGDKELASDKLRIDLSKPLDLASPKQPKTETRKLDSGTETISVNGKDYACSWVKTKSITRVGTTELTAEATVWTSKDVPLNGIVRIETISDVTRSTMELVEFGTAKK